MHALIKSETSNRMSLAMAGHEDRCQIYRMRHDVYACQLHQYPENERGELSDALDKINLYIVAKRGSRIVGFVSITPQPGPYSLDKYIAPEQWPVEVGAGTFEIRLLTVADESRGSVAGAGLMYAAMRYVQSNGGTHVVGIGREQVLPMYVRVGMQPNGQTIKSGAVTYHVMAAEMAAFQHIVSCNRAFVERLLHRIQWKIEVPIKTCVGCFHGGVSITDAGDRLDRISRAAKTINADVLDAWFDPSPRVLEALRDELPWLVRTSPPADCMPFISTVADVREVPRDSLVPGAGSSDLIFRCLRHWLNPDSNVLLLDPTYGEYAHVLESVIGCHVDRLRLHQHDGYALSPANLAKHLEQPYDMVILVNPNSPTGTFIPRDVLGPLLLRAISHGTRIWVDETYIDYAGPNQSLEQLADQTPGLFVCKSMSKAYALSGMRVAYLCGHFAQTAAIRTITPPWVIGLPAQVAAVRALEDPTYYQQCYAHTQLHRDELVTDLRQLGLHVQNTPANFILIQTPLGAAELVRRCIEHGVYLRDTSSMGARDQQRVRVAVKSKEDNRRIVNTIKIALENL